MSCRACSGSTIILSRTYINASSIRVDANTLSKKEFLTMKPPGIEPNDFEFFHDGQFPCNLDVARICQLQVANATPLMHADRT
jgi:hypothetical protein